MPFEVMFINVGIFMPVTKKWGQFDTVKAIQYIISKIN